VRGFAASRAESLRLSVMPATLFAATPPEAKPLFSKRRTESLRLSAREMAKPENQNLFCCHSQAFVVSVRKSLIQSQKKAAPKCPIRSLLGAQSCSQPFSFACPLA